MRFRLIAATLLLAGWVQSEPDVVSAIGAAPAERTLLAARDLPAGWQGRRDRDTGVVAELYGSYVPAPGAVADPVKAEAAARAFVASHLALLAPGVRLADLTIAANVVERGLRTVSFRQTWRGAPVIGGQLAVMIENDRVFAAASQIRPNMTIDVPARAAAVDTRRALDWIGGRAVVRSIGPRVVLPIDGGDRVADQLDVEALDRAGRWDVFVGIDGAPLLRRSRLYFASSTMQFDTGLRYPTDARHNAPVPSVNLTADAVATTTANDGTFSWTGSAPSTVVPSVVGPLVAIVNQAGALATASLTAQPGTPLTWSLASDEFSDAQLTAFINASISKARARVLMPSLGTWLDQPLSVYVNEDDVCNAYSTGDDIHFFRKGTNCENTGRLADVTDHEFGHSVHNHAIIAGVGAMTGSLSEGLADFFASTIVDDHGLGRGFLFNDNAVRDLDPVGFEASWPRDKSFDPHITGLIIGGTLWDLRKALIAKLGQAAGLARTDVIFAGVLQRSPDIPGTYLAAQLADDDDGNLGNGTPNGCTLVAVFGKHGLAPGYVPTTVGVPVVSGTSFTVPVTIPAGTCPPTMVTKVELAWHVGAAAPSTVAFMPSGTNWVGSLPPQPDNTVVHYKITATLDDGSVQYFPDNPANPEYTLYVGTPAEIWCEHFDADPHWTASGASDWQWAPPAGVSVAGDPTTTYKGDAIYGTDLKTDGAYSSNATSHITTPDIDASLYEQVHLQYWRWLTIKDGLYDQASIEINDTKVWSNAVSTLGDLNHIDKEWRFQDVDVTPYASAPFHVTWSLTADMNRQLGGWTLDEVCIVGINKHASCGDGVIDDGEQCDDGNTNSHDGCSAACAIEDDGGCCSAGTNPAGPLMLGLGVVLALRRRKRRHGS